MHESGSVVVQEIAAEGVPESELGYLPEEVQLAAGVLADLQSDSCPDVAITLRVVVTNQFEARVREARAGYGLVSPDSYSAARSIGQTGGSTVCREGDELDLAATIVLDAAWWQCSPLFNRLRRIGTLIHESAHVWLEAHRRHSGVPNLPPPHARTFDEKFLGAAELHWEEYWAETVMVGALRTLPIGMGSDGEPISAAETYAWGLDESVASHLDWFCGWTTGRWPVLTANSEGMMIVDETAVRADEMFGTLARTLGVYVAEGRLAELPRMLGRAPGFRAFLGEDWEDLVDAFRASRLEAIPALRDAMFRFLFRIGYAVEGTPEGFRIYFFTPAPCVGEAIAE